MPETPIDRAAAGPHAGGSDPAERPTAGATPLDAAVRERVTTDLGTTFLLEASAGTGKTSVLVARYVRCVLDPQRGAGDVRSVAAITFTEKAAGELRQRVREDLELRASAAAPRSSEAERVERALEALDDAPIGTIHGFAGSLLREYPVEAGIDPAFEQLDGLASEIERDRLWGEWLGALAGAAEVGAGAGVEHPTVGARTAAGEMPGAPAVRAWLARLLRAGVRLDHLRQLAAGARGAFGERYDLDPVPAPPAEPDLAAGLPALAAPLERLSAFCGTACHDPSDRGFCKSMLLVDEVGALLAEPPAGVDDLAAALYRLPVTDPEVDPGGRKEHWDAARGGKDELRACFRELAAAIVALREAYATYVTGLAVAVADAYARWAGEAQIALGRLDFTDLLGRLRDLLLTDRATRGALQRRFRYVLVDEFQDTDPLQAEIVFFLCEREPRADDWRDVELEPGKLFVVGDPKQSIYRFRRADIALYDQVTALIRAQPEGAAAVEVISQNFRTTPALVEWVNGVFTDVFERDREEGRQPGYHPVVAFRPPATGPRAAVLLGREYAARGDGENEAARRNEARAIAALLCEMHDPAVDRWHVQDRAAAADPADPRDAAADPADPGGEPLRPPRWADIAVLFRVTTGLETYEQALRDAGVPYRVDGGTTFFQRREVADALLCLRAVDDPSDGPALYGALHSTLFGFSDDELFLFDAAGGRFDLFAERQPSGHEAVVAALGTLRRLCELRGERESHELAAELVRVTHAAELAATTGSGAPQALANLEKLVERARAFSAAGGGGLGAFLSWAREAGDAAGEQESQVDDEGDVVRLLTIHKAKGLEYPIVVLAGGALAAGGSRDAVRPIVDRRARRLAVKLKVELPAAGACDVVPPRYEDIKEREDLNEASELRRLLYVAATRARDRLVVSCFGRLQNKDGKPAGKVMLAAVGGALPAAGPEAPRDDGEHGGLLVLAPASPPSPAAGQEPDVGRLVAERERWQEERRALLGRAGTPARATSPSGLEHVDDEVREGGAGAPPGRATALALGSLVHEVMELCDLGDESSVARVAAAAAARLGRPDLAARAAELALACWRSAPVRAAAGAPEVHRELPVGALIGDTVVNGAVDLLYRDGAEWVIVDYKTDRGAEAGTLRERYAPQGAAYAVAVEKATGRAVREVVLVAAAADGLTVHVPVDEELRASVAEEVAAAVNEGRAIRSDETAVGRESAMRPDELAELDV
jgi:ATP-dependent helicase/nuclease subunit A